MKEGEAAFAAARDVSRETLEQLNVYAALLDKWNPRINLVSRSTLPSLWARHFLDSAQIFDLAPEMAARWCDLGSGGGFPGLVVAILAQAERPALSVTLIESDKRKAGFLRTVARETGLKIVVLSERLEEAEGQAADVLSARALAPLPTLLSHADRHLAPGGLCLFPKGVRHDEERRSALELWRFRCETLPSRTDPDAVIFRISELSRA